MNYHEEEITYDLLFLNASISAAMNMPTKTKTRNEIILFFVVKSFFDRPLISRNMLSQKIVGKIQLFSPYNQRQSFTLKSYSIIRAHVSHLFFDSYPSTIFFKVIALRINAINLSVFLSKFFNMLKIGFMHIISKLFKGFPQTLDSFSAVSIKTRSLRFIASSKNIFIDMIESSMSKTMTITNMVYSVVKNITTFTTSGGILNAQPFSAIYTDFYHERMLLLCK